MEVQHLTIGEAAKALKCSPKTVRAAIKSGRLRATALSKRTLRIPAAQLATFTKAEEEV